MRRRVVVTGLGTINPLGEDVASFWAAARAGESGVGIITAFDASEFPVRIAAEAASFDPEDHMERKDARRLDRFAQFFSASVAQAITDAGLTFGPNGADPHRCGVVAGTGIGGIITFQDEMDVMRRRGINRVSPLAIPKIIANMAGGSVSIAHGLLGPNAATVTACAASANAIGDAAAVIRRGDADVMIAGGAEAAICEFAMAGFSQARALSTRNEEPQRASRPFDAGRDGFVMGEGGAALVLESEDHARRRDARIYAEVSGYGMSADAYHITLPRPGGAGAAAAMRSALDDAGLEPARIGYINAHGTSTPANDPTETAAIRAVFGAGASQIPVSSSKSMTGHLLGGAGALEALVCILAMRDAVVPPTINYDEPDPECDLDYVPNTARPHGVEHAMTNSFGFGGHNVALVLSRYET